MAKLRMVSVALVAASILVVACGSSGKSASSGASNTNPNPESIKTAISSAIPDGCWSPKPSGGNFYGAYQQHYFTEGTELNSTGTECVLNLQRPTGNAGSQANLQTFHSAKVAAQGAKKQASVSHFLAVYQGGVYVLSVTQSSRPEFAQVVQHAAESNGMSKVPGS